jgi:hypothetical protein
MAVLREPDGQEARLSAGTEVEFDLDVSEVPHSSGLRLVVAWLGLLAW